MASEKLNPWYIDTITRRIAGKRQRDNAWRRQLSEVKGMRVPITDKRATRPTSPIPREASLMDTYYPKRKD